MTPRHLFLGCLLVLLIVSPARAALTYDLRLVGTGDKKTFVGLTVNQTLNLELWAMVTGAVGNAAQEGFQDGYMNILSSRNSNVRGNLSCTLTTTFAAAGSQNGTAQDLDSDADRDIGSKLAYRDDASGGPAPDGNFFYAHSSNMQTTSGTVITNGREFKLANLTFTVTMISNPLDPTITELNVFIPDFKSIIDVEAKWQEDGQTSNPFGLSPGGNFPNGFPVAGAPVQLRAIPEPASAGLLGAGASFWPGVAGGKPAPRR